MSLPEIEVALAAARAAMPDGGTARRVIGLIDLTNLDEGCTEADVTALAAKARTKLGAVAALCVWPRFVSAARKGLEGSDIRLAAVANFPGGGLDAGHVAVEIKQALADGAGEIDLVFPWRQYLAGDRAAASALVRAARDVAGLDAKLKVILETGAYPDQGAVQGAAMLALESGADMLKTSTGKIPQGASLEAAATLLEVIADSGLPIGLKVSGGIRDAGAAAQYLALADAMMGPDWATAENFRFGASGLLDALLSGEASASAY